MFSQDPNRCFALKLQWLDALLHREILRLRATYQLSSDEFRGLYISDEQVNAFINQALSYEGDSSAIEELTQRAAVLREADRQLAGNDRLWRQLAAEFSLSLAEQDVLLMALAPELDLKYERLYAYLNNDVTRKSPTNDLALRVLGFDDEQQTNVRRCLTGEASLFRSGLLQQTSQTPERPSWRSNGFSMPSSVFHYLSGIECLDQRLPLTIEQRLAPLTWEEIPISPSHRASVGRIARLAGVDRSFPLLVFSGRDGSARKPAAEAICQELGLILVSVDLGALRASPEGFEKLVREVLLQQRLLNAGLYLERPEAFFDQQGQLLPDAKRVIRLLSRNSRPVFIATDVGRPLKELLAGERALFIKFDDPDYAFRLQLWERVLATSGASLDQPDLELLADNFALTPGQIEAAVATAVDEQTLQADFVDSVSRAITSESIFAAARAQSDQSLGNLAVKVKTIHTWEDLVLPVSTVERLKEVTAAIKYRHVVYSDWGFEQRVASGLGLKALFTGASGTGKTMTTGVIARDLGLDVYKIDLSTIVSKYIGETEKNLDRVFLAARSSNAILFFDEADALFGKRSEVKDAHDRHANIEVAYLLQKIEDYDGVVILATNLSKNIDEAFSRRMHYVVEFPLPDDKLRERLWRGMFPVLVPLEADVDFRFLAKQFSITGGDIRNVALDAAFMAAQDGRVLTMNQLIKAMARQLVKQGRVPSPADFKQYHALIVQGG